jgi:hypothetical protein
MDDQYERHHAAEDEEGHELMIDARPRESGGSDRAAL